MSDEKYCVRCGRGVAGIGRPVAATRCGFCGGRLTPYEKATVVNAALVALVVIVAAGLAVLLR